MTDRLKGKVALITGGASGLGANAAALMAQEGASVVVADIAADRGKAVADKLGSAGHFVKLDVTSEDNWKAAIRETVDKFGALHVLLNSAGIGLSKTVEDITLEEWRKVHAIDLDGVFLGCKHGVAEIKKHTEQARAARSSTSRRSRASSPAPTWRPTTRPRRACGCSASRWRCIAPSRATTSAATRCIRPSSTRRSSTSTATASATR